MNASSTAYRELMAQWCLSEEDLRLSRKNGRTGWVLGDNAVQKRVEKELGRMDGDRSRDSRSPPHEKYACLPQELRGTSVDLLRAILNAEPRGRVYGRQ